MISIGNLPTGTGFIRLIFVSLLAYFGLFPGSASAKTESLSTNCEHALAARLEIAQDIKFVDHFVQNGLMTPADRDDLVNWGITKRLHDLHDDDVLDDADYKRLTANFSDISHGPLLDAGKIVLHGSQKLVVYASRGLIPGNQALVLTEGYGGRPLAILEYALKGSGKSRLDLDWMNTIKARRGQGLQDLLFAELLSRHPQVRSIKSTLGATNAEILRAAISRGATPEEALSNTPLYLTQMKFGFIDFKIEELENKYQPPDRIYQVIARKP